MEINPFKVKEELITKEITHGPVDRFDANSLLIIVSNILKRSTKIVDQFMQVNTIVPPGKLGFSIPNDFKVPMCIIKSIGCELFSCKDHLDEFTARKTTVTILNKLRSYSWEAKAVLTLAAFAKEFGDLVHLDQTYTNDQLTKSLAILKGSLFLPKTPELRQKRKSAIVELNKLIILTLEVMEIIFASRRVAEFLKLGAVYGIIMTVIACANVVTILTSEEDKPYDFFSYSGYISDYKIYVLRELGDGVVRPRVVPEDDDDERHYELLKKLSQHLNVMDFLRFLFSAQGISRDVQLIDCSNNYIRVDINVLSKKKVFFVVSRLGRDDISDFEISILKRIQSEKIKQKGYYDQEQYAIVWVPIADDKDRSLENWEFERMVRSKEIQWYTLSNFVSHRGSIKYIVKEWQLKTSPILVLMDLDQGKIETTDAFYIIRLWGLDAFPFDNASVQRITREMSWITTIFSGFLHQYRNLANWVENDQFILLHGGNYREWANEIEEKVAIISREANIRVEHFDIDQDYKAKDLFWSGVNNLSSKYEDYAKTLLTRLSSWKEAAAQGWFVLIKGSITIVVGSRDSFLSTVRAIKEWKENVLLRTFEVAFKEYHEKIYSDFKVYYPKDGKKLIDITKITRKKEHGCEIAEVSGTAAGKTLLEQTLYCETCYRQMEVVSVNYKCCHTHIPTVTTPYYYN